MSDWKFDIEDKITDGTRMARIENKVESVDGDSKFYHIRCRLTGVREYIHKNKIDDEKYYLCCPACGSKPDDNVLDNDKDISECTNVNCRVIDFVVE